MIRNLAKINQQGLLLHHIRGRRTEFLSRNAVNGVVYRVSPLLPQSSFNSRSIHTTHHLFNETKPKSNDANTSSTATTTNVDGTTSTTKSTPAVPQKDFKEYWQQAVVWTRALPAKIKAEAHHYWVGSKLLVLETRTTVGIVRRILKGHTMTRRERRQLVRTFSDMLRLVPFAVIVIIPFMELALPVLLKLFPNMLPSTFEDKLKKEESLRKKLKAKIELAKFLQDAADELGQKVSQENTLKFSEFMHKVRTGEPVSNTEILKIASMFEDEFTLDNAPRAQLVAMCKYMGLPPFGGDSFLRFQLSQKLKQLKEDDKMIRDEGVNNLTIDELQSALRARGMRGTSNSKYVLRKKLNEWLDLSLNHNLPESILILSRAFVITENETAQDALKETISSLPDDLVEEIKLKVEKDNVSRNERLEALEHQNELIAEEIEQKQEEELKATPKATEMTNEEKLKKDITEAVTVLASASPVEKEKSFVRELKAEREKQKLQQQQEQEKQQQQAAEAAAAAVKPSTVATATTADSQAVKKEEKPSISTPSPSKTSTATTTTTTTTAPEGTVVVEKQAAAPSTEIPEKSAEKREEEAAAAKAEEKISKRLENRLDRLVQELEKEVEQVEKAVGTKLNIIDKDNDGVISTQELEEAVSMLREKVPEAKFKEILDKYDSDKDGKISLKELLQQIAPGDAPKKEISENVAKENKSSK